MVVSSGAFHRRVIFHLKKDFIGLSTDFRWNFNLLKEESCSSLFCLKERAPGDSFLWRDHKFKSSRAPCWNINVWKMWGLVGAGVDGGHGARYLGTMSDLLTATLWSLRFFCYPVYFPRLSQNRVIQFTVQWQGARPLEPTCPGLNSCSTAASRLPLSGLHNILGARFSCL